MSTPAERMRALRKRAAQGRVVLQVEVHIDRLALALGEDNFLAAWDDSDKDAITVALERMIEAYTADMLGPDP